MGTIVAGEWKVGRRKSAAVATLNTELQIGKKEVWTHLRRLSVQDPISSCAPLALNLNTVT